MALIPVCPKCFQLMEQPFMEPEVCEGTTEANIEVRLHCRRQIQHPTEPNRKDICTGQLYHYIDLADFTPA